MGHSKTAYLYIEIKNDYSQTHINMIKTTIFTRALITLLSVLGIFQITQFFGSASTNTKDLPTANASLSNQTTENDVQDAFLASLPEQAKTYITDHFALDTKDVEWIKRDYGMEAIFKQNGRTYEVEFDHEGNWVETELENVPAIEIPSKVIETAKALHPTGQITEFEIELTAKGTFYEIEMTTANGEVELYLDSNGKRMYNTNED
jgi:uncharacterized membrane protein YkoI